MKCSILSLWLGVLLGGALFGEANDYAELNRRVAELGVEDMAYLGEKGGPDVIDLLRRQARTATDEEKRVRALRVLHEIDGINHRTLSHALNDPSARVVGIALRLSDGVRSQREFLLPQFLRLSLHASAEVRKALLEVLIKLHDPVRQDALVQVLRLSDGSSECREAIMGALNEAETFPFLFRLAALGGEEAAGEEVIAALIAKGLLAESGKEMAGALEKRLKALPLSQGVVLEQLGRVADQFRTSVGDGGLAERRALEILGDRDRRPRERGQAMASLGLLIEDEAALSAELMPYLHVREPIGVQLGVLSVLSQHVDNPVEGLLKNWRGYSPVVRINCLRVALAADDRALALLRGVELGQLSASEVPDSIGEPLRKHRDIAIATKARRLLVPPEPDDHGLEDMEEFKPEPGMVGESLRGRVYVAKECSMCHRVEGLGRDLGPSLVEALDKRGEEDFLYHFFDTGHEVPVEFVMYRAFLGRSQHLIGAITEESDEAITFNTGTAAKSETRIPRSQIRRLSTSSLALMPDGDDFSNISRQAVADVLAYLNELRETHSQAFAAALPEDE